ncbi:hypothetical protein FQN49_008488 [Arthroderma sp. PD_2]|nr:hypothetical protein FQN49_008488 [Arthroderma sp. PD_2]
MTYDLNPTPEAMHPEYPICRGESCWGTEFGNIEFCENAYNYRPGGLCPVLLGDTLEGEDLQKGTNCSFGVIGKLGYGSYSTVWLVGNRANGDFCALKILTEEHSTPQNSELQILTLTGRLVSSFFYTHVPTQQQHLCLVMKPVGCSLARRDMAGHYPEVVGLPWDIGSMIDLVETLLTKVSAFHDRGIYHGDLSPSNICLGVDENAFEPEALAETFKRDLNSYFICMNQTGSESPPPRPAYIPEYVVRHQKPLLSDGWDLSSMEVIDFGRGGLNSGKSKLRGTPFYEAPEGSNLDTVAVIKADLWSLGCVIVYGLIHKHLFCDEEEEKEYIAGDENMQLSIIERQLEQGHTVLKEHTNFRKMLTRLIHSLVRVDPAVRDAAKAKELLGDLIKYAEPFLESQDDEEGEF